MSEEEITYGKKYSSIELNGPNGIETIPLKKAGKKFIPIGSFIDNDMRFECIEERIKTDINPLLIELEELIKEVFRCELNYELSARPVFIKNASLDKILQGIDDYIYTYLIVNGFISERFTMQIIINCTKKEKHDIQFWGTVIDISYWGETWLQESTDHEYRIWMLDIENVKTFVDTPYEPYQKELILSKILGNIKIDHKYYYK